MIFFLRGTTPALEFLTGYLIELSLSVDNLFVFLAIFTYFRVRPEHQHRVLFWGILGAIVLRIALILGLSVYAWRSIAGGGNILAPWIAVKVQIFALLIFFGLMIRVVTQPFVVAFGKMMREGSSPELEAQISGGLARSKPWVIAIWIGLVAAAFVGLQKPGF